MVFHHSGGNECKLCSSHCGLSVSEHTSDVCGRSSANALNMLEWSAVTAHLIVSLFGSFSDEVTQWQSHFIPTTWDACVHCSTFHYYIGQVYVTD